MLMSSSRLSIISIEGQRSLFKRLNYFTFSVVAENSNLKKINFQTEILYFGRRILYLYGESVFKLNQSYALIFWRAILRICMYTLVKNSEFLDEELINAVWILLDMIKKKNLEKYLFNEIEKPKLINSQQIDDSTQLFSGIYL